MSRGGRKHDRIHQCVRCEEHDAKDEWCVGGNKAVHEPLKLRWCNGFKPIKPIRQPGEARQ